MARALYMTCNERSEIQNMKGVKFKECSLIKETVPRCAADTPRPRAKHIIPWTLHALLQPDHVHRDLHDRSKQGRAGGELAAPQATLVTSAVKGGKTQGSRRAPRRLRARKAGIGEWTHPMPSPTDFLATH
jgi:hypothetical protein